MKRISTALLIFLFFPLLAGAAIFTWTDRDGVRHYSDDPVKGANKLDIPELPTYTPPSLPLHKPYKRKKITNPYYSLDIYEPVADETIKNNMGYVNIEFELRPGLYPGDTILVLLDGKIVQKRRYEANISLLNVERGTHTTEIQVIDKEKKLRIRSRPVKFYMRRSYRSFWRHKTHHPDRFLQRNRHWHEGDRETRRMR